MQRIILIFVLALLLMSSSALAANSWVSRTSSTTQALNDVQFISASTGIAVGNKQNIIRTTNYGKTWSVISESALNNNYAGVYFVSSTGWAAGTANGGGGYLSKSTDSGASWSQVPTDISLLNDIFFTDANTGYAPTTAAVNMFWKTTDGGTSWSVKDTGLAAERTYTGVYFIGQTGWVVGNLGIIYKTTNGADLWAAQVSGTANQLNDVIFVSSTTGWVAGDSGTILKTTDGGTNWVTQVSGTANNLNAIYFVDASNGWVVGAGGTILKTTDGGTTWTAETSGTTNDLNGVHFTDVNNGCAVGAGGTVLKYALNPTITSAKHGRFTTFAQGGIYTTFTITGTLFNSSVAPTVTFDTADITPGAVTTFTDTTIVLPVTFASGTAVGNHTLTVTNPEGGSATLTISVLADSAGPSVSSLKINNGDYTAGMSIPFVDTFTGDLSDVTGLSISPTDDLEFTLRIESGSNIFYKTFTGSDVYTAATATTGSFRAVPNRLINFNTGEEVTFGSAVGVASLFTLYVTAKDIDGNQGSTSLSLKFAGQSSGEKAISNVLQAPNKNPTPANPVTIQFESKENLGNKTIPIFSAVGPVANLTTNIVMGTNKVTWDGNTFAGQSVASGLYLVRIINTNGKIVIFR
ncbi:MAG: YCF48-related protein [Candidatus Margulisiibacteriota bacterium]